MRHVITGGPGFGKTSIINELKARGYWGGAEVFDGLIASELASGGDALPWLNREKFEDKALPLKIEDYLAAPLGKIAFYDRGFPDHIAYCKHDGFKPMDSWLQAVKKYPYSSVFLVPPWPDIYEQDTIRREPYNQAVAIHERIVAAYLECGYAPIEIPPAPISERADFVLRHTRS